MTLRGISRPLAFMIVVTLCASELRTEQGFRCIGWIEEIQSPAYLKTSPESKIVTLDGKRDRFRRLQDGELVQCGSGGSLKLQISGKIKEIKEIKGSSDWLVIHPMTSSDQDIMNAIESYGHIGGRDRPLASDILSPSPGSAMRAKWASFRWVPNRSVGRISLVIQDGFGSEIWRQDGIDGATGLFASDAARATLERYAKSGTQQMFFGVVDSNQQEIRTAFTLLSSTDENALDHALERWSRKGPGLLRHAGRAFTFGQYKLFAEAAAEYEMALKLAPESEDLLTAAIQAYGRVGNSLRTDELKQLLSASHKRSSE
ncbi:MAG: hypothetical protein DMG65_19590 [Candidatus Angelobacter sp. Gp1-AA117]|nr:MAG: hypothetical protein DMG65_19590 [Candidatus Angelobacter sp. Gp1-AA117]